MLDGMLFTLSGPITGQILSELLESYVYVYKNGLKKPLLICRRGDCNGFLLLQKLPNGEELMRGL